MITIRCFLTALIPMALAELVTITNVHTVQEIKSEFATTLVTKWTTIEHPDSENPTLSSYDSGESSSTSTSTSTTTTTKTITRTFTTSEDSGTSSDKLTATSTSQSNSISFPSLVIKLHNEKRSEHSAQDITWSQELTNYAQSYADSYNCNGTLIHSDFIYGDNLALGYNTTGAIEAWYDEVSLYDYNNPGFSEKTGHFTQLVWNSTAKVGCATKNCGSYFGEYLVCEYDPAGNVEGQYDKNVFA